MRGEGGNSSLVAKEKGGGGDFLLVGKEEKGTGGLHGGSTI